MRDVQGRCPMNRGGLGARALNLEPQAALNPPRDGQARIERFGRTHAAGDKVMQGAHHKPGATGAVIAGGAGKAKEPFFACTLLGTVPLPSADDLR